MNSKKHFVIINPTSGGGLGKRLWPQVSRLLKKRAGDFDFAETRGIGHARLLSHEAAGEGYRSIIALGGDGTIHEVVNGIFENPVSKRPPLGVLCAGTGGDFIKTLGWPQDIKKQIEIIAQDHTERIDVGQIEYRNSGSKKEKRIFINIADAGLGGEVVRRLPEARKKFGRKLAYITSTIGAYRSRRQVPVRIKTDHAHEVHTWPEKPMCIIVANGRYFGGGMPISPTSSLTDGYLDLIVVDQIRPLLVPVALPLLYSKQLIRLPHVAVDRVKSVTLTSVGPMSLDVDGEPVGFLPARLEILPKALEIKTSRL